MGKESYWFYWQTLEGDVTFEGPLPSHDRAVEFLEKGRSYVSPTTIYSDVVRAASREEAEVLLCGRV